jgi:hypothetical protein
MYRSWDFSNTKIKLLKTIGGENTGFSHSVATTEEHITERIKLNLIQANSKGHSRHRSLYSGPSGHEQPSLNQHHVSYLSIVKVKT